jgi:hypothetical protein
MVESRVVVLRNATFARGRGSCGIVAPGGTIRFSHAHLG